jgi:hypothetical protein
LCYLIRKCRKGASELENIVNMAKEKKYKKDFAELPFTNVNFNRMVMIFYGICTFSFIYSALGLLQYSKIV